MCQDIIGPTHNGQDEWFLDNPAIRAFIEHVRRVRCSESDPNRTIELIEPEFKTLLANADWLPDHFAEPSTESGMGSGIGMWLLFRAGDGSLAFSSLVVPPGASTPVHDHLAWGLVGLYRGTQDEVVYSRTDDAQIDGRATLDAQARHSLNPGDLYELLPETDIHQVRTTSPVTSVSLHLLGNDNGCMLRHRFHPEENRVEPFKSGWLNVDCAESSVAMAGMS
jgi:predicted metal-dependent enzyme (double-stranded beta helix superfamily)